MTYTDLTNRLATYLVEQVTEANFAIALPAIIEQAELRCYRDIDFMATRKYAQRSIAASSAVIGGPADWLIGRALTTIDGSSNRKRLERRDETFLNEVWPNRTVMTIGMSPKYWAEISVGTLLIAPTADQAYILEMAYTFRPVPLSGNNPTTWLSLNAPDLLFYAAMVAGSGYVKAFGPQSTDPQMALSWEAQYTAARDTVMREEGRRKAEGVFDVSSPPPSTNQTHGV